MRIKLKRIKSQNLVIKNFLKIHISKKYINWLNDKEVVKFSSQKKYTHTYESCLNYYKKILKQKCFFLAIFCNKKHIGNIYCKIKSSSSISIRILIGDKKYWGRGIGFKVYCLLIDYFFFDLKFLKVYSNTLNKNIGMKKIFKKLQKKYNHKIHLNNKVLKIIFYK